MVKRDAVVDASFWINVERTGLLPFLLDYFLLYVPPKVSDELLYLVGRVLDPPPGATAFREWIERNAIRVVTPERPFQRFDDGENEAIALALEQGWDLLIDDETPRHYSRGPLGLRVVDSPAFTVYLYDQGRLTLTESRRALHRSLAGKRMISEARIGMEILARRKGDHE